MAVLAERDGFVRLELLEPRAEAELMSTVRPAQAVFIGEQVAGHGEVAAIVASGETYLCLGV